MDVRKIVVIGAGQMGTGIAQVSAAAGFDVRIRDVNNNALQESLLRIHKSYERAVERKQISSAEMSLRMSKIAVCENAEHIEEADLIIEAVTENQDLKSSVLKEIVKIAKPAAIIASNTSSLSITRLASITGRQESFIGLHFFYPVPTMELVEVIPSARTTGEVVGAIEHFVRRIGKIPICIKNSPGFVVNRILLPMINEAVLLLQEGVASREQIDACMTLGTHHPVGPLALADAIGLDTCLAIMTVLHDEFREPKFRPARMLVELVDGGCLGKKTKQGFYQY